MNPPKGNVGVLVWAMALLTLTVYSLQTLHEEAKYQRYPKGKAGQA